MKTQSTISYCSHSFFNLIVIADNNVQYSFPERIKHKRADGESIRRTLRTDIYRMIKLNFIRELVGKVEAGGITNFCKKRDIKEMMNFLNSLLIPSMAVDSTDSSLDTIVAPSGRCRNEQHSKPQNISWPTFNVYFYFSCF